MQLLKEQARKHLDSHYVFFWSLEGEHTGLEESLKVQQYPSISVGLMARKKAVTPKFDFNEANIDNLLDEANRDYKD
jgi:hypothetical protein